jgi:hypothetical protein
MNTTFDPQSLAQVWIGLALLGAAAASMLVPLLSC